MFTAVYYIVLYFIICGSQMSTGGLGTYLPRIREDCGMF
jgi:hypothetical protein